MLLNVLLNGILVDDGLTNALGHDPISLAVLVQPIALKFPHLNSNLTLCIAHGQRLSLELQLLDSFTRRPDCAFLRFAALFECFKVAVKLLVCLLCRFDFFFLGLGQLLSTQHFFERLSDFYFLSVIKFERTVLQVHHDLERILLAAGQFLLLVLLGQHQAGFFLNVIDEFSIGLILFFNFFCLLSLRGS